MIPTLSRGRSHRIIPLLLAALFSLVAIVPAHAVELNIMVFSATGWVNYHKEAIANFEKENPDITVKMVPGDPEKLQLSVGGGVPVDVFYHAGSTFTPLAYSGFFQDLRPFIEKDASIGLEDFFPAAVAAHELDDTLYGLPQTVSPVLLLYNKSMFDEAGASYPDTSWNWKSILNAGKKLTRDTNGDKSIDRYAWSYATFSGYNRWPMYVWQNGGDIFSQDGTRVVLDQPAATEALAFYRDLGLVHRVAPLPDDPILNDSSYINLFNESKAAMVTQTRYYKPPTELNWDLTLPPMGQQRATTLITNYYSILKTSKHPEAAWRLVKYLLTVPTREGMLDKAYPAVPAYRTNAIELIQAQLDERPSGRLWLEAMETARSPYYPPISTWSSIVNKYFNPWGKGEISTQEMVEHITHDANAALAELQ